MIKGRRYLVELIMLVLYLIDGDGMHSPSVFKGRTWRCMCLGKFLGDRPIHFGCAHC
jgi:hypothetical protein